VSTPPEDHTPSYVPVHAEAIPAEVRDAPRFVCWQPKYRVNAAGIGKWTKVPYNPAGYQASSTRPRTWSSFDRAIAAYARGTFAGIGWNFLPPYAGLDFDGCLAPDGTLDTNVAALVAAFDSYTEYSVSGTGLHVLVTTSLGAFGHKKGPREAYSHGRFFTLTGKRWPGTPPKIHDRTDLVRDYLHTTFGSVQGQVVNGAAPVRAARFIVNPNDLGPRTRVWLESTGPVNGKPSASEADSAAACALLASGRSPEEALALLADSPRGRDALERKGKGGMDYLERTVRNAASHVGPRTGVTAYGHAARYVGFIGEEA